MRCATDHAVRCKRTGAIVYDKEDNPEQQYERTAVPVTPTVLLSALIAVVSLIAVLAAWTSA